MQMRTQRGSRTSYTVFRAPRHWQSVDVVSGMNDVDLIEDLLVG